VATTLRDFDMPGTQPLEGNIVINDVSTCASCHADYNAEVEPFFNWRGSMMSMASRDPLFEANLVIANQDAPDSGDLCLRCHDYNGWVQGRSVPTNGSAMLESDLIGVSCDQCHRMVDPVYEAGVSPTGDSTILTALSNPGTEFGIGMLVVDPDSSARRGPFNDAAAPHSFIHSPFHREAALCGTCHDVSNPAFEKDGSGNYVANATNTPATDFSAHSLVPVERTYSEWLNSAYNTPVGVVAPAFAGNAPGGVVRTCQDCHMRDHIGQGCDPLQFPAVPTRPDMPKHDMTGGSSWLMNLMPTLYPEQYDAEAVQAGILRSNYLLTNAASLETSVVGSQLKVRVINQTGHKLPTGYPEGRRIWINARFYDELHNLIAESAAYDAGTGVLNKEDVDPTAKIYEVKPGLDHALATALGLPEGPSFHFVLNNKVFKDNRIPPRGFTNAKFATFGGTPVGHSYADGDYWDDTYYGIPAGTAYVECALYYQSTSKEFVEFLRDENNDPSPNKGDMTYKLWSENGKCPPVLMASTSMYLDLVVHTTVIPGGQVNSPWSETFTAGGGTAPYTWNITGSVPSGLILSPDGILAGTPTAAGDYPFTVKATDSSASPLSVSKSFVLSISNAPEAAANLVAAALSDSQIELSWDDLAGSEDGYVVQHSPDGSTGWVNLVTLSAGSTGHIHSGLPAQSTHFYRVAPYAGSVYGAFAGIASATTEIPISAAQVTLFPVADSYVKQQGSGNENFGLQTSLLTTSKSNQNMQAYLRFDLSGINTVESATLQLYRTAKTTNTSALVHAVANDSWTETGITWNNKPPAGLQLVNQALGTAVNEYKSFVITSYTAEQAANDDLLTVMVTVNSTNDTHEWYAREQTGFATDPRLVVFHSSSPDVPSPPRNLSATLDSSGSIIHLNWTDGGSGETGFLIERSLDGVSGWTLVGSTAANHTNWSDTGLDSCSGYAYRIRAANSQTQSGYSNPVSATTGCPAVVIAPGSLRFARNGGTLEFRFPTQFGVTYQVQQSEDLSNWVFSGYSAAGCNAEMTMTLPMPLPPVNKQFYRIIAID
jgi:Putative Ig domain